MSEISIDFAWACDPAGYKLVVGKPLTGDELTTPMLGALRVLNVDRRRPRRVVRLGTKAFGNRPLEVTDLYLRFAELAKTPEGALTFVTRYGPLTDAGHHRDGELVAAITAHAQEISDCISILGKDARGLAPFIAHGRFASLADIEAGLYFERDLDRRRLILRPKTLLDAIWLQFAQAAAGGANITKCRQCGSWFEVGTKSGRRSDAKFCSPQHRYEFNNSQRRRK